MKQPLLLALTALLLSNANGQVQLSWARSYSAPGYHTFENIAADNSGNVWIMGTQAETTTSNTPSNLYIAKYTSAGALTVAINYGTIGTNEQPGDVVCDAAGNVYVSGRSYVVSGANHIFLLKFNSSGTLLFSTTFNTPQNYSEYVIGMGLDAAGNIYLGGHVVKEEAFSYDFFTIKFNAAGVYQWHQLYNGTANGVDFAVDFAVDAAGNVYITGESAGRVIIKNFVFNSLTDFATLKYNSAGVQQWVARYSVQATNSFDKPVAMTLDASGNVYVTGYSTVSGSNNANCTTVKYNSVGAQQWAAVFQGPAGREDYSADVHVDGSGNVFIGGTTINTAGNRDMIVVKYNPSGVQQWWGPYDVGAGYSESAVKGGIDAYGSFYLTGQTSIPGVTNSDIVTLKWTTNGVRSWVARYNSPSNASEHPNDMVVVMPRSDLAGQFVNANIFVTGSNEDPLTLKYSQPLVRGLASETEPLPNGYAVGNHPNPFKSSTNITYELPDAAHVTINVFDVMGRKVSTLVNGNRSAGSYVQRFTAGKSTSGVYFYQFVVKSKTGEVNTTRSMTIQR